MLTNNDVLLLKHIAKECDFLLINSRITTYNDFIKNPVLMRAFERSIEIICEAAKKLSTEFRNQYPHINWRAISGMRDKLIHYYFGVDYQIVWDVATNKTEELLNFIDLLKKKSELPVSLFE
jgi:uncharacterized protein with HEPN domain